MAMTFIGESAESFSVALRGDEAGAQLSWPATREINKKYRGINKCLKALNKVDIISLNHIKPVLVRLHVGLIGHDRVCGHALLEVESAYLGLNVSLVLWVEDLACWRWVLEQAVALLIDDRVLLEVLDECLISLMGLNFLI